MDVAAIGIEVDDRVAHDLPRPVIGDVAAAPGVEHLDAQAAEPLRRGEDVAAAVLLDADRQDVGVLQQQQRVGNSAGSALLATSSVCSASPSA